MDSGTRKPCSHSQAMGYAETAHFIKELKAAFGNGDAGDFHSANSAIAFSDLALPLVFAWKMLFGILQCPENRNPQEETNRKKEI
jgi:hypothetical protein